MIKQIAHMALEISNLEKSLEFYCGALGFEQKFVGKNKEGKTAIAYLKVCDGVFIEMFPSGVHKIERVPYQIGYHHMCFEVDDINEAAAKIQAKGVTLTQPVKMGGDYSLQFWVNDPDGNPIEFMQYTPESMQSDSNTCREVVL